MDGQFPKYSLLQLNILWVNNFIPILVYRSECFQFLSKLICSITCSVLRTVLTGLSVAPGSEVLWRCTEVGIMPVAQTHLNFPVRKSSRRKIKVDKENVCRASSPPSSSTDNIHFSVCKSPKRQSTKTIITKSVLQNEQTPSQALTCSKATTPSKRVGSKAVNAETSPSKRRSTNAIACDSTPLPLSPCKHVNVPEGKWFILINCRNLTGFFPE